MSQTTTEFVLHDGTKIDFTECGLTYTRNAEAEAIRLAESLIGAALQKDMSGDLRETLLGVQDQFIKARAARRRIYR